MTKLINSLIKLLKKFGWSSKGVSDKWHTFGDLYNDRMMLSKVIADAYPNNTLKALLHDDGTMFDGSFILVFKTLDGYYTYHYPLEHWDLFDVPIAERAPKWDGHTSKDIGRLFSLVETNGY